MPDLLCHLLLVLLCQAALLFCVHFGQCVRFLPVRHPIKHTGKAEVSKVRPTDLARMEVRRGRRRARRRGRGKRRWRRRRRGYNGRCRGRERKRGQLRTITNLHQVLAGGHHVPAIGGLQPFEIFRPHGESDEISIQYLYTRTHIQLGCSLYFVPYTYV